MRILPIAFAALSVGALVAPRSDDYEAREVRRIRAHFDSVLTELDSAGVSNLSGASRAKRARLVVTLRDYRNRGAFPHNYDFAAPTPYFVDRKTGVHCAVGHLMASTGRKDIVERISSTNNNVLVRDLAGDTAVASWLSEWGLSVDEAARIQPAYGPPGPPQPDPLPLPLDERTEGARRGIVLGAATVSSLLAVTKFVADPSKQGTLGNVFGYTLGLLTAGVSWQARHDAEPVSQAVSAIGVLAGLSSMTASIVTAVRQEQAMKTAARVSMSPFIPVAPDGSVAAGARIAVRF